MVLRGHSGVSALGSEVCMRTFNDSHGQRRMSAMNSAQAEETAQPTFLYLAALAPAALA